MEKDPATKKERELKDCPMCNGDAFELDYSPCEMCEGLGKIERTWEDDEDDRLNAEEARWEAKNDR